MDELGRKSVDEFRGSDKRPIVVVLDNIRSMHNVGSVFRTADAFLLEGIVLCGYTPRPPHRDIHKTALGATETVAWEYAETTVQALQSLREEGYSLFAIEQTEGSIPLQRFLEYYSTYDRRSANQGSVKEGNVHSGNSNAAQAVGESGGKLAVVFGNEVSGITPEALALCDVCIEIPQWGMKHSLNISVAAGIVLWELVRKRGG
jgi:tRNA G18 (ribose-2'-O)-methylase SpoU